MTDPVLAIERNSLAWQRTALSAFGVALLLLKLAVSRHRPLEYVASGTSFAAAACAMSAIGRQLRLARGAHRLHFARGVVVTTTLTALFVLISVVTGA
jgi:uncharacterized membrane protein YidH (DUF202 family)